MKNSKIILLIILLIFGLLAVYGEAAPPEILVFYDLNCNHCKEVIEEFWWPVQKKNGYAVRYYEVNRPGNYDILLSIEDKLNDKDNEFPIFIVNDRIFDLYQIEIELIAYLKSVPELKFRYPELLNEGEFSDLPIWEDGSSPVIEPVSDLHSNLIYFYEPGCKVCARVSSHLEHLKKKYPTLIISEIEVSGEENLALFNAFLITYGIDRKAELIPSVFVGNGYLLMEDLSYENLDALIQNELPKNIDPIKAVEPNLIKGRDMIFETFKGITLLAIIIAGLIDGINPCAFATLIFFISYLTVMGRTRRQIVLISFGFTLSIFITYFLISLGLFSILRGLTFLPGLGKILYLIIGILTFIFGIISFHDYYQYRKGDFKKGILQISVKMRDRINRLIKKEGKIHSLFLGSVITGFIVAILEFTCTGQVLIPTLGAVMSNPSLRTKAVLFILIYNSAFILPLIIIFIMFYRGVSSERFGRIWKSESPAIKLTMGIIFIILSFFIIYFGVFA